MDLVTFDDCPYIAFLLHPRMPDRFQSIETKASFQ